jgi:hypothetical protein
VFGATGTPELFKTMKDTLSQIMQHWPDGHELPKIDRQEKTWIVSHNGYTGEGATLVSALRTLVLKLNDPDMNAFSPMLMEIQQLQADIAETYQNSTEMPHGFKAVSTDKDTYVIPGADFLLPGNYTVRELRNMEKEMEGKVPNSYRRNLSKVLRDKKNRPPFYEPRGI